LKWIGGIFKKHDTKDFGLVLPLSDFNSWLEQRSYRPEFEKAIQDIYYQIGSLAVDLERDMKALRHASANEATPPRLLNAALAAREAMLNHIEGLCEKLDPPAKTGIDEASKYHSIIVKALGNTVSKFGRSQRYVAALFPKEAENIKYRLNRLSHHLVDLNNAIEEEQKLMQKIGEARELGTEIHDEIVQIRSLSNNASVAEQELEGLLTLQEKTATDLQELKSSAKGQEIAVLQEMLGKKRNELIRIESQMAELISPMTKAFVRLVKQDSSDRLELSHRREFELLSSAPHQAQNCDICGALRELRSSADLLGLKDKKREKILGHIDRLIKDRSLELLIAQHFEIEQSVSDLEQKLAICSRDMMRMEDALRQTALLIEEQKIKLGQIRNSLSSIEDRILKDKNQLESMLEEIAGKPVTVNIEN
jgi:hypothetical protein